MRIAVASLLLSTLALPIWADVSPFPIEDAPPQSGSEAVTGEAPEPAATSPVAVPDVVQANVTEESDPAIPATVSNAEGDAALMDTVAPLPAAGSQPEDAEAVSIRDEPTTDGQPEAAAANQDQAASQPEEAAQDGTQADAGSSGSVAVPATQPSAAEEGTSAQNAGTTGWTGGTGGSQIGTTPAGALPQSRTWQPPVASGLALRGEPRS
ncbi:hypothetical protein [Paracoccus aerodenitrificans]|uniref:hypothetical protein n=1 Tax=Paracoccus aerodenitrificans TaxID=3017781 RepID=UPI0022EFF676|nr:hypothetical protein [Paracoccus aerodenitrificans]WBU65418.1 hypothetical protein PAE61_08365 [Paracoccus aerodenitrificans]